MPLFSTKTFVLAGTLSVPFCTPSVRSTSAAPATDTPLTAVEPPASSKGPLGSVTTGAASVGSSVPSWMTVLPPLGLL